jgi:hypothetical protein
MTLRERGTGGDGDTAAWYRRLAASAQGHSAPYARLAESVAADTELLGRIDTLPRSRRQPMMLLGAVRFHGGPVHDYAAFRTWTLAHWEELTATMARRRTQTNEAARCTALLPLLASLPRPLALIEMGAAAGLCLFPDRYRYAYTGHDEIGPTDSPVLLPCEGKGPIPLPARMPEVAWRAGADLNPVDLDDAEELRWLESLIWPGAAQDARRRRLHAAAEIVRADPAVLVRGDAVESVAELVGRVPAGTTPVVFHSAVLPYLTPQAREAFREAMEGLPGVHWVCNESAAVALGFGWEVPEAHASAASGFVLSLDGRPVAATGEHGQYLHWFDASG